MEPKGPWQCTPGETHLSSLLERRSLWNSDVELEPSILVYSQLKSTGLYTAISPNVYTSAVVFPEVNTLGSNWPLCETPVDTKRKFRKLSLEPELHCCNTLVCSTSQRAWFFAQTYLIRSRSPARPKGKDTAISWQSSRGTHQIFDARQVRSHHLLLSPFLVPVRGTIMVKIRRLTTHQHAFASLSFPR